MQSERPPRLKLTQELVGLLPARVDAEGPPHMQTPPDTHYEQLTQGVMATKPSTGPLWVFAVGSLIWNPRMPVGETRPALVKGWRRAFCLGPTVRRRGNPDAPGRMLSLDRGGECWGVVMRMEAEDEFAALKALLKTEPPVPTTWVKAETAEGIVDAIAFTADTTYPLYSAEPEEEALAEILASAVGTVGTMAEYLLNTVVEMEKAGIHDPYLWRLQEMVADRLESLRHAASAVTEAAPTDVICD